MPNYRRANIEGGTFFFTVVTYRRRPLFIHPESR
jgi:putative transposase